MTKNDFGYLLGGAVALLVLKYNIVGLNKWNAMFHPERLKVESGTGLLG